jgi:ADP-ribose pyrophosphatase YjhB (NUDIX family)
VKVKARAVIPVEQRLVIARERRQGCEHLTLPGGRPERGELLQQTVAREALEEVGMEVRATRLLYVAQVVAGTTVQELILVFLAEPTDGVPSSAFLLAREDSELADVFPPILSRVFDDLRAGWPPDTTFLDNIHVPRARIRR